MADVKLYSFISKSGSDTTATEKESSYGYLFGQMQRASSMLGKLIVDNENVEMYERVHLTEKSKYLIQDYVVDAFRVISGAFDKWAVVNWTEENENYEDEGVLCCNLTLNLPNPTHHQTIHQLLATFIIRYCVAMWIQRFSNDEAERYSAIADGYLNDAKRLFYVKEQPVEVNNENQEKTT